MKVAEIPGGAQSPVAIPPITREDEADSTPGRVARGRHRHGVDSPCGTGPLHHPGRLCRRHHAFWRLWSGHLLRAERAADYAAAAGGVDYYRQLPFTAILRAESISHSATGSRFPGRVYCGGPVEVDQRSCIESFIFPQLHPLATYRIRHGPLVVAGDRRAFLPDLAGTLGVAGAAAFSARGRLAGAEFRTLAADRIPAGLAAVPGSAGPLSHGSSSGRLVVGLPGRVPSGRTERMGKICTTDSSALLAGRRFHRDLVCALLFGAHQHSGSRAHTGHYCRDAGTSAVVDQPCAELGTVGLAGKNFVQLIRLAATVSHTWVGTDIRVVAAVAVELASLAGRGDAQLLPSGETADSHGTPPGNQTNRKLSGWHRSSDTKPRRSGRVRQSAETARSSRSAPRYR